MATDASMDAIDVVVIGAGPAGLAAAVAAREAGARDVLVLERDDAPGGILTQCVHDGFGLHLCRRSLTGPEYAALWEARARDAGARIALRSLCVGVSRLGDGRLCVEAVGQALGGHVRLVARSVVVATGCRERTRGQLLIPGTRPAGVLTAGSAQRMVNVENQLPGDKAVILGAGDIGLIMARRLTLEGAQVRLVLGQALTGLLRNQIRCAQDFGVPVLPGWGIARIHGSGRLSGVSIAPMREDGSLDLARRRYVRCNTLLLACGLIPETEVLDALGDSDREGVFLCGNAAGPRDLVDQVTQQALLAGVRAAVHARPEAARTSEGGTPGALSDAQLAHLLPEADGRAALMDIPDPTGRAGTYLEESEGRPLSQPGETGPRPSPGIVHVPCTACPRGCVIDVRPATAGEEAQVLAGAGCPRGHREALRELTNPLRTFTGTVRLMGSNRPLLSVRTAQDVPRELLLPIARACRRIRAHAPVHIGDVVRADVAGSGVDLVATAAADEVPSRPESGPSGA